MAKLITWDVGHCQNYFKKRYPGVQLVKSSLLYQITLLLKLVILALKMGGLLHEKLAVTPLMAD